MIDAVVEHISSEQHYAVRVAISSASEKTGVEGLLTAAIERYLTMLEAEPYRQLAVLEIMANTTRSTWISYRNITTDCLTYIAGSTDTRWSEPTERIAHHLTTALGTLTVSWLADRDSIAARRHAAIIAKFIAADAVPHCDEAEAIERR
ncbi:hypothetical protein ACFXG4_47730 [Nocardia sp. NPDC059246]|uniref:hypothetical protein n=1 Tax=unclassified Nocardia TaxID=2637762 RepID=UPI0036CB17BE